jgi:hypothetical protein
MSALGFSPAALPPGRLLALACGLLATGQPGWQGPNRSRKSWRAVPPPRAGPGLRWRQSPMPCGAIVVAVANTSETRKARCRAKGWVGQRGLCAPDGARAGCGLRANVAHVSARESGGFSLSCGAMRRGTLDGRDVVPWHRPRFALPSRSAGLEWPMPGPLRTGDDGSCGVKAAAASLSLPARTG